MVRIHMIIGSSRCARETKKEGSSTCGMAQRQKETGCGVTQEMIDERDCDLLDLVSGIEKKGECRVGVLKCR